MLHVDSRFSQLTFGKGLSGHTTDSKVYVRMLLPAVGDFTGIHVLMVKQASSS